MHFNLSEEIRKYPFIRIVIPFIVGIIIALNLNIPQTIALSIFVFCFIAFIVLKFLNKYSQNLILGMLINLILIFSGFLFTQNEIQSSKNTSLNSYKGFIIGEISTDPKIGDKTIKLSINILAIKQNNQWLETSGKTILYLDIDPKTSELKPGNRIIFTPSLSDIQNNGNPEEFDYKQYLSYSLIYSTDYLKGEDWQLLESYDNQGIQYKLLEFRSYLIGKLKEFGLSNDELGVASALVLGYQDTLSDEVRHSYSSAGAMHILAVSGMHVGIIYGIIVFLLSFIKSKKYNWLKVLFTIVLIWLYAILTGFSPSVARAATMFSLIAFGNIFKRPPGALNAIAASAFILLFFNPLVITSIGFQLSYLAVIGIIVAYQKVYELITIKNKWLDKIWSLTAVSVVAQIATAPLALYYFSQFSNYFLLGNYLLIPISTVAIWLTISVFFVSWFDVVATFLTKILAFVMKAMNYTTSFIESLPYSISENIYINLPQLLLLYFSIIMLGFFFLQSKKYNHLMIGIAGMTAFFGISLFHTFQNKDQQYIVVYNINKATAINLIDGKDNILFANLDSVETKNIEFSAKSNWLTKGLDEEKYINISSGSDKLLSNLASIDNQKMFFKRKFIAFQDVRIFIVDQDFIALNESDSKKFDVDFIVISNSPPISLNDISQVFNFKKIIIDSSNSFFMVNQWLEENKTDSLPLHNVKTDGAFVYKM